MGYFIRPLKRAAGTSCLITAFLLADVQSVHASGVVNAATEAALRAALVGGGTVTFAIDGTIVLTNTLTIDNPTIVDGTSHVVTLSGNNAVRVFTSTNGAALSLINLTIANGLAAGPNGTNGNPGQPGGTGYGGGVLMVGGTLTAINCQFLTNTAAGGIGGNGILVPVQPMPPADGGSGGDGFGGAIELNAATLLATNCQFYGNLALGNSGGLNSGVGGNVPGVGGNAFGGAIHGSNSAVVTASCLFQNNQSKGGSAGAVPFGSGTSGGSYGGAVSLQGGGLTNVETVFIGNTCSGQAIGGGRQGISGKATEGGAIFSDGGFAVVVGSMFISNSVTGGPAAYKNCLPGPGEGGAIFNGGQMQIAASVFDLNSAIGGQGGDQGGNGEGGAIFNAGQLSVSQTWFSGNLVQGAYGIFSIINVALGTGIGGAIKNASSIAVLGCTFSDNQALGLDGPSGPVFGYPTSGSGGGLFNSGSCLITNSTMTGNVALGGSQPKPSNGADAFGGALYNSTGTVYSVNNTFAGNVAQGGIGVSVNGTGYGGGIYLANGTVSVLNSIVANNLSGSNAFGTLTDLGHNLSSDASCNFAGPGSLNNFDPVLAPLDDYGGPTPTMALLAGSPAIDGGINAAAPSTDQRGHARPYGAFSDIGAFESSPPYIIAGQVSISPPGKEVGVAIGAFNATTTNGYYSITGLPAATHTVFPSDSNYVFSPSNRVVTVGPDQIGVDFKAYQWQALTLEGVTGEEAQFMYAGTNGQNIQLLASTNFLDWFLVSTNTVGSSNLLGISITVLPWVPKLFFRTVAD